ncbi:Uncharacterized protein TCAP_02491 [Tolypocladium capitatum]|uniref:Uncharacterized protein n=1 Tax=Tolypocladium capitatum TaxID=45235 RepID=A0A2K3QJ70_9HYPO|nr:Uncharacterized protein TCAP_02491 [Tolypocladium capitatum]
MADQGDQNASRATTQRRSDRSHEENQERAYIAASRRADRSIEARVQSARMASTIHKKRTGKALHITEQIVMNEEMYEEEDDDLPRSFRLLGSQSHAGPSDTNPKADDQPPSRAAMSALIARTHDEWRENEINQLFAASFPLAEQQAQQLSQAMPSSAYNTQPYNAMPYNTLPYSGLPYNTHPYSDQPYNGQPYNGQPYNSQPYNGQPYNSQPYNGQPYNGQPYDNQPQIPVEGPLFQPVSYIPSSRRQSGTQSRTPSRSDAAPSGSNAAPTTGSNMDTPTLTMATSGLERHVADGGHGFEGTMAAMAAPTYVFNGTMVGGTPTFHNPVAASAVFDSASGTSAFTAELAPEATMPMGIDAASGQATYGQQLAGPSQHHDPPEMLGDDSSDDLYDATTPDGRTVRNGRIILIRRPVPNGPTIPNVPAIPNGPTIPNGDYFDDNPASLDLSMSEEAWKSFIDDAAWGNEQS